MNDREKKLILVLLGAGFLIVNLFAFTSYSSAVTENETKLKAGKEEIKMKIRDLEEQDRHLDEVEWLAENMPVEGTHATVRAELVTFTEQSMSKRGIEPKNSPTALRENFEEDGPFRYAVVKTRVNCRDRELYNWLCDLQDPKAGRSITRLRIEPLRNDPTKIDCEIEVTQWYSPVFDDEEATAAN